MINLQTTVNYISKLVIGLEDIYDDDAITQLSVAFGDACEIMDKIKTIKASINQNV